MSTSGLRAEISRGTNNPKLSKTFQKNFCILVALKSYKKLLEDKTANQGNFRCSRKNGVSSLLRLTYNSRKKG